MNKIIRIVWTLSFVVAGAHCNNPRTDFVPLTEAPLVDASMADVGTAPERDTAEPTDAAPPIDTAMMPPTSCSNGSECPSGFCVSGVCCNTACEGSCQSCKLPGREGTCAFVAAGSTCGEASCAAGVASPTPTCDGKGSCRAGVEKACAPFVCGMNACTAACTANNQCAESAICLSGQCVAEKPSIVSVSPPQGLVAANSVFVVTFTQKMDQASTVAAVSFLPDLPVTASWDAAGKVLTLTPKSPLLPLPATQEPRFTLTVGANAKNVNGLSLAAAPVVFSYRHLRKYENYPCSLMDSASVTSGYMGGRVGPDLIEAGTSGTNVPGRIIQSRGFVSFACGGTELQQAQEVVKARLVFKVATRGTPSSPEVVIKPIPDQADYTAASYDVEATGPGFTLNANNPGSWSLDVTSLIQLMAVRAGSFYEFRAETATSPSLSGFDGYNLTEPQMFLDFIAR